MIIRTTDDRMLTNWTHRSDCPNCDGLLRRQRRDPHGTFDSIRRVIKIQSRELKTALVANEGNFEGKIVLILWLT